MQTINPISSRITNRFGGMQTSKNSIMLLLLIGLLVSQTVPTYAKTTDVWKVSPRLARLPNPISSNPASLATGKKIFVRDCQGCHGSTGKGDGEMAAYLGNKVANLTAQMFLQQTDGAIFTKIRSGKGSMPGFKSSLEKEEVWHLLNYIRSGFTDSVNDKSVATLAVKVKPEQQSAEASHKVLYGKTEFPSAQECGVCHKEIYREWSVSRHAFSQISPTFLAYQATLVTLTKGTLGDFCERCHTEVGMYNKEPILAPNSARSKVALEGITCVVCHRVPEAYGKVTGRLPLESGDISQPIYGPRSGDELKRILDAKASNPPKTHKEARLLEQVSQSGFCARCHDVRLVNGVRFEDLFSEFKQTPAAKKGNTCQSCHMGPTPGVASDYPVASAAIVRGEPTRPNRRTNHMFPGPDSSVVHPGLFPINSEAQEFATADEWLSFDVEAGWGSEIFESHIPEHTKFPGIWGDAEERKAAREIIDKQLQLLAENRTAATTLMKNGYGLGEIKVTNNDNGLEFDVEVKNLTDGHNVPSGLIAERNVFLQVTVIDADGKVVFRSGDLDPNGDVRDTHSLYVDQGLIPQDQQLFNLRSPIMVGTAHGGDREQVLPANYSLNPLIFVRPSDTPSLLMGGIRDLRLQKKSIEALGKRQAHYQIDPDVLTNRKPYQVNVKLVAGQLPPHLINAISGVGLEYGLTARSLADKLVDLYRVLWEKTAYVD